MLPSDAVVMRFHRRHGGGTNEETTEMSALRLVPKRKPRRSGAKGAQAAG
jgi:hypothetical protein